MDLGCGRGIFSFELAKQFPGSEVLGVDIATRQVAINNAIATKRRLHNLRFEEQDLFKIDYKERFDLVLSVDNLEHVEDDVAALRKIHQALKPGGTLVCHVPAYERTWLFWGRSVNFDVPGHVRPGYRAEELQQKLQKAGFVLDWMKPTYGYLETLSNNISYLITGADQKHVAVYALVFPILNFLAWLGRHQDPGPQGAGLLARAVKPATT